MRTEIEMQRRAERLAKRACNARVRKESENLLEALRRCVPWLGRMIADGGHEKCVMPNDAIRSLQMAEQVLDKLRDV